MLEFTARKCTGKFLQKGVIEKEREDIYIYGFQLLFSTAASIISILFLSLILNHLELGVTFVLTFIPIRMVAGGFHANTYGQCFIITNLIFLLNYFIIISITTLTGAWMMGIMYLAAVGYIVKVAPIIHKNHPVNRKRYDKNKKNTLKILTLELCIIGIIFWFKIYEIVSAMAVATSIVAIMMLICQKSSIIPTLENKAEA